MNYRIYFAAAFLLLLAACTKFEDAEMTERNTFVHFYSSGTNFIGSVAEPDTDGGFILTGEIRNDNGVTDALVIKTDARGHKVWEKVIPNGLINAIKVVDNGYILLGDSIELNPSSPEVSELVNSYAKLLIMDTQGSILGQHIKTGSVKRTVNDKAIILKVDFHGNALTVDHDGNIIILGTFRIPGENEYSFVSAFNPSDLSDSLWYRSYGLLGRDYVNCNALHMTPSSKLVWASKTFTQEQNLSREYLSISFVEPKSTFENNSVYGERDDRNHSVEDIQKSSVGYAAIGTYSEPNGSNSNIYFVRIDPNGNIVPESARYIDGEDLILNHKLLESESKTSSGSNDEGLAIVGTSDGYVLAGSVTSTPTVGNGGKDIVLIKVDAFGNLVWSKLIGGTGDETVCSIRETPDKGLLLCGTNTINGLSSIMLVKTDRNGNLDN